MKTITEHEFVGGDEPESGKVYTSNIALPEGTSTDANKASGGKVTLACNDLGNNVAREIASGNIAGGGAQMPYDQGVAEAKLAALALLGEETPSYVAVPAETVTHENVLEAYTDVYHVETPDWLKEAYVD